MFDLTAIFIVGFIVLGTYKLFELYAKRNERLLMIEKFSLLCDNKEDKEERIKIRLPFIVNGNSDLGFWPLRISLLLIGIGAGCLLAFFLQMSYIENLSRNWNLINMVNFASITFLGGLGLLIAFLIEQKIKSKKKE